MTSYNASTAERTVLVTATVDNADALLGKFWAMSRNAKSVSVCCEMACVACSGRFRRW